jgi:phosphoglycolate phosphatase
MPEPEVLRRFIGPPIQDSFAKQYQLSREEADEMAAEFRRVYKDIFLFDAVPYDGIYECMDELVKCNVKIAVATYKRQDYAERILKHFHFDRYSNVLYGADFEGKLKKMDIIKKCMTDLGSKDYSNAVMIGDSWHDADGAEQIGVDFIGVTYGFDFQTDEDVRKNTCIGSAAAPMDILKYFE